jgi:nitroreductase
MELFDALNSRSTAKTYGESAPSKEHLAQVLQAAVRAPDHGRLRPWRFMLIEGNQRRKFGELLAESAKRRVPGLSDGDLQRERDKAMRAPTIIIVMCRVVPGTKVPAIEQVLAAGAATQNLLLALHAQGYAAAWKTGEAAYDPEMKKALGLSVDDHLIGFVYVGGGVGATGGPGIGAHTEGGADRRTIHTLSTGHGVRVHGPSACARKAVPVRADSVEIRSDGQPPARDPDQPREVPVVHAHESHRGR